MSFFLSELCVLVRLLCTAHLQVFLFEYVYNETTEVSLQSRGLMLSSIML